MLWLGSHGFPQTVRWHATKGGLGRRLTICSIRFVGLCRSVICRLVILARTLIRRWVGLKRNRLSGAPLPVSVLPANCDVGLRAGRCSQICKQPMRHSIGRCDLWK